MKILKNTPGLWNLVKMVEFLTGSPRAMRWLKNHVKYIFNLTLQKDLYLKGTNHRVVVMGETFYTSDLGVGKTITKKGKSISLLKPKVIEIRNCLKGDKSPINRLVQNHFGKD